MADRLKAIGTVFMINDVPYLCTFDMSEEVTLVHGDSMTMTFADMELKVWQGVDKASNMLPLYKITDVSALTPVPPRFDSLEEADAWLDSHPALS